VFGLSFQPSEFVLPGILLGVLGIALLGIAQLLPRSDSVTTATKPPETVELPRPAEAASTVTNFVREITWPTLIDDSATNLDDAERLTLIEGLAFVANRWSTGVLTAAFEQESGDLRIAVIEALAATDSATAAPTLERAYSSYAVAERYAAIESASRQANVPLLERALRDTDGSIALAAAYGLHRAGRNDLVDDHLNTHTDARANEIRRILPMLTIIESR
jgi:hypothetical protein